MPDSEQLGQKHGKGKTREVSGVLLANPRWEWRSTKFLELSGVGRVMADGTDEDGAHAASMDEWGGIGGGALRGEG
jgi:hypothetical protein